MRFSEICFSSSSDITSRLNIDRNSNEQSPHALFWCIYRSKNRRKYRILIDKLAAHDDGDSPRGTGKTARDRSVSVLGLDSVDRKNVVISRISQFRLPPGSRKRPKQSRHRVRKHPIASGRHSLLSSTHCLDGINSVITSAPCPLAPPSTPPPFTSFHAR